MNAPAIPYIAPSGAGGSGTTMRLLNPGNAELPTSAAPDPWWSTGWLLTPSSAPSAGAHRLSYLETCTALGASAQGSRSFDFGGATALPTQIGALHGANRNVGQRSVVTSSGSCFTSIEAVTIDLRVTPSPELMAHAAVTGFKLNIDGKPARSSYYGAATTDATGITVFKIHAGCGPRSSTSYDDYGVTQGDHDFELTAHTAGASADPPPVVKRLRFSCTDPTVELPDDIEPPKTEIEDVEDASVPVGKATTDRDPVLPKGSDPVAAGQPETAVAGCACSTASSSRSSGAGVFASLLAVAALIGARARRRAT